MVSSSADFPKYLQDIRIYQPSHLPCAAHSRFVGKPVTVIWQAPIFSLFGGGGKDGPLHELVKWYGYVVELDKQIPDTELIRQPRLMDNNKPRNKK